MVPLFINPFVNVIDSLIVLFHTPLGLIVTNPLNVFVPFVFVKFKVPFIVVNPATVSVALANVLVVPVVTSNVPLTL